jgi:hypothetical protein
VVIAGGTDFTGVGHVVALILGMVVATRFGRPRRWTPARVALLAVGGSFGYSILVSSGGAMVLATAAGLAGGALGTVVTLLHSLLPPRSPIHPHEVDLRASPVCLRE